jgi:hypothetical protein
MRKYLLIFGGLFALGLLLQGNSVLAVTISPPVKEITGNPGETVNGMVKIYNETNQDFTVYSSLSDFTAKDGEGGEPQLIETKEGDVKTLSSWIDVPQGPFEVKSLDWQSVIFQVKIPENAEPGGHYAAIFFGPSEKEAQEGAVSLNFKAGSLILLRVSGEIKEEGFIKDFYTKLRQKFYDRIPVVFELRVQNNGSVHFKPRGMVEVKNMWGGKVAELPILKEGAGGNVLPQSVRKYDVQWGEENAKNPPIGFWGAVKYEWNNFYIGRYAAKAVVSLPLEKIGESSITIWVFPWQLILVLLAILIVLAFIFRGYNRWIIKKAREGK